MKRFVAALVAGVLAGRASVYVPLVLEYVNNGRVRSIDGKVKRAIIKYNARHGGDVETEIRENWAELQENLPIIKEGLRSLVQSYLPRRKTTNNNIDFDGRSIDPERIIRQIEREWQLRDGGTGQSKYL